jgi:hypothetical protein
MKEPDIFLRYQPILKILKNDRTIHPKILDVGSGDQGISAYIKGDITGVDVAFSENVSKRFKPIVTKGVDLPFENDRFDFVISVDMLEHIPKKDRETSISEMLRVCKKRLILIVPTGQKAEQQDRDIARQYENTFGAPLPFLADHLQNGLPGEEEILSYIRNASGKVGKKVRIKTVNNTNLRFRGLFLSMLYNKHPFLRIFYRFAAILFYLSLMLLYPIRELFHVGDCYRKVFFVEVGS